ncbi:MAG: hypothetical protein Q8L46_00095, partial [candidate division WWE3 bacterium]|nr:hypothetical protein [candidate division WWE3 bacterium]
TSIQVMNPCLLIGVANENTQHCSAHRSGSSWIACRHQARSVARKGVGAANEYALLCHAGWTDRGCFT